MSVFFREGGPGRGPWSPREEPKRTADKAVRRANGRRILRLFRPYTWQLGFVFALIVVSSALGVVSPFLLRAILDDAIQTQYNPPQVDVRLLTELTLGMVGIAVVTGAFG